MSRSFSVCLLVTLVVLAGGCRSKRPDGVLSPGKMENVLYDYHLANAVASDLSYNDRYEKILYYNYVFEKHEITEQEFDSSLVWYTRNPSKLQTIYKKLSNRIEKDYLAAASRHAAMGKKQSLPSGDTVDIWLGKHTGLITSSVMLNPVSLSIQTDTTFHRADSLCWTVGLSIPGIPNDTIAPRVLMYLSAVYGDSISTVDTLAAVSSIYSLSLRCDASRKPTRINAAATYIGDGTQAVLLDVKSLSKIHVKRGTDHLNADSEPDTAESDSSEVVSQSTDSIDMERI